MSETFDQPLADAMSQVCSDDDFEPTPASKSTARPKPEPANKKPSAAPRRIIKAQRPAKTPAPPIAPPAAGGRKVTQTTTRTVTKRRAPSLTLPRGLVSPTGRIKRLEIVTTETGEKVCE